MENRRTTIPALRPVEDTDVTTWELPEGAIARLGRGITADLAFSPDGESLAVATTIGVWLYELPTLKPIALLATERGLVSTVSFSPNGQWIATSNWDGIVRVWETETQQCTAKIQGTYWGRSPSQFAFSPDSQYLAASAGDAYGGACVWDAKTGMHVAGFKGGRYPKKEERLPKRFPVCFSPDGQCLAYVRDQVSLGVRHIETKEHILYLKYSSKREYIQDFAFSPCGGFLAIVSRYPSTSRQKTELQVWDIEKETLEMADSDYGGDELIPAYASDGTLRVADIYKDKVVLWDASERAKLDTFEYQGQIRGKSFSFSYDGQQFAIATERELRLWHADAPLTVVSHVVHTLMVRTLFFMQGGKTLVSGYVGKSGIVFWDVAQKSAQQTLNPSAGQCALSPCEEILATLIGENNETIEVLNVASGTPIATLTKHQCDITALAFSPTGEHLVSGDEEGKLYVWSVGSWGELEELIGHNRQITGVAFHPNGSQVATTSYDHTARVWDVESGEQFGSPSVEFTLADASLYKGDSREIQRRCKQKTKVLGIRAVTFSPCGNLIAGGLWGEVRLWDAATLEPCMGIILPENCSRVGVVVFSPCGQYLVSGSWWNETDKVSIRVWEVATGENVHTFWSHPTDIQDLAFSPDGELLASGSFEGTILLWDMKPFIGS